MTLKDSLLQLLTVKKLAIVLTLVIVAIYGLYVAKPLPVPNNLEVKSVININSQKYTTKVTESTHSVTIVTSTDLLVTPTIIPPTTNNSVLRNTTAGNTKNSHLIDTKALLEYIHYQCDKLGIRTTWKNPASLNKRLDRLRLAMIVEKYNFLFVSNPKTGSTSFKKFIKRLNGATKPYSMLHATGRVGMIKIEDYMKVHRLTYNEVADKFYTIGFIRNPMIRTISGYRDKVTRKHQKMYVNKINAVTNETDEVKRFHTFVNLIVNNKIQNPHFRAQYNDMKICSFPYDLLGQTETTKEQIALFQNITGTKNIEYPGSRKEIGADKISSVELAHKYFDTMSPELLEKFYQFFKYDFELTGYTKLNETSFPYIDLNRE